MTAVLNLLAQMTTLLHLELEESSKLENHFLNEVENDDDERRNPLDSIKNPPRMPCLDMLLSENVLSHVLAISRMPVSYRYRFG